MIAKWVGMNKSIIKKALDNYRNRLERIIPDEGAWEISDECATLLEAIAELDKPKYFPLGQESVNQQCLSCRLNCPNDCPLDKQKDL